MRSTSTDGQGDQSQPGDQRDNHHAAEEEGAKPIWEVLETTSSAISFHSCDAEPIASPGTLDTSTSSETTQKQDVLRWPHRAVSREWQAMSWKRLELDTKAFRFERLCLGRLLLTKRRCLCQPGWARTRYPGNGNQRYENALDTESEDELQALQELYKLDKKPSSERVPRRKTARSKQPEKWSFLR